MRLLISIPAHAFQLAVSQYGRVTASLPWAVAMEKGYFADAGVKIDEIIAGAGGGTTLRNVLASDLPYGEVATSAALAAVRSGLDVVIVNSASSHIGEIALVADPKSGVQTMSDLSGKKAGYHGAEVHQRNPAAARAQGNRPDRQGRASGNGRLRAWHHGTDDGRDPGCAR